MLFEEEFRQWELRLLLEDFVQRSPVAFGYECRVQVVGAAGAGRHLGLHMWAGTRVGVRVPAGGGLASGEPFRKGGARGSLPDRRRMGGRAVPGLDHDHNLARFYVAAYY
ncbi:hypothetical protein CIB93_13890 [Streptomyces sp. WZ.A104]|nr:hypothetical protein CIB93_13890 [Streptomyces sp. WZ.A104]